MKAFRSAFFFLFLFSILMSINSLGFINYYQTSYRIGGLTCGALGASTYETHPTISDNTLATTYWNAKAITTKNITTCIKTNVSNAYGKNSIYVTYDVGNSGYWNDYAFFDNSTGTLNLISHHNSTTDSNKFGAGTPNITLYFNEFISNNFCIVWYSANSTSSPCSMSNVHVLALDEITWNTSIKYVQNNTIPSVSIKNYQNIYCKNESDIYNFYLNMSDSEGDTIYYSYGNYVQNYLYITEFNYFSLANYTPDYDFFTDGRFLSNGTYNTDQTNMNKQFRIMQYPSYTSLFWDYDSEDFYLIPQQMMLRNASVFMGLDIMHNPGYFKIGYFDLVGMNTLNLSFNYTAAGNLTIYKNDTLVMNKAYLTGSKFYVNTNYTGGQQICFSTGDNLGLVYCIDFNYNSSLSKLKFYDFQDSYFRMIYYGFGGDKSTYAPEWILYQDGVSKITYEYETSVQRQFNLNIKVTDDVNTPNYDEYDFPITLGVACADEVIYNGTVPSLDGITEETTNYVKAIPNGEYLFNSAFYLVLFVVFIGIFFASQSLELALFITGISGLLGSFILTLDLTQMITSSSLIALGVAIVLSRIFIRQA